MKHDWYDPRYEEPRDPDPRTPREQFERDSKAHRRCRRCKVLQKLELVDYDRLHGSKYRWLPLAGRCMPLIP